MRRTMMPAIAGSILLLLAGCGLQPSGVEDGPPAPTGVAPGTTLYFIGGDGDLVAQERETRRLGTVSEAVSLLLTGPGTSDVGTGIGPTTVTRTEVTVSGEDMSLRIPMPSTEVTAVGVDQIVCTALANHIQAGESESTTVAIGFTDRAGEPRTCPVFG